MKISTAKTTRLDLINATNAADNPYYDVCSPRGVLTFIDDAENFVDAMQRTVLRYTIDEAEDLLDFMHASFPDYAADPYYKQGEPIYPLYTNANLLESAKISQMTLRTLYPEWLSARENHVKPHTIRNIIGNWKRYYINDSIIDIPLTKLNSELLSHWTRKTVNESGIRDSSHANAISIIRQMCRYAAEQGYIAFDPFASIEINWGNNISVKAKKYILASSPDNQQVPDNQQGKPITEKAKFSPIITVYRYKMAGEWVYGITNRWTEEGEPYRAVEAPIDGWEKWLADRKQMLKDRWLAVHGLNL